MKKVAIIGGGAAGLCCADEIAFLAKKLNKAVSITVFESNERVGKKLLATGNGRCNLTNLGADESFYCPQAKDFIAPTLSAFPPQSTVEFFQRLGLFTHFDSEGRVYPLSNQAAGVLDALRLEGERLGVRFELSHTVKTVEHKNGKYIIDKGECFESVVLCCGGKSGVKQHNGYELLKALDHSITKTAPSLVKLTTASPFAKTLKGIRASVRLTLVIDSKKIKSEDGELLFGDGVLSGIAAMNLSPYINRHYFESKTKPVVSVDFVPDFDFSTLLSMLKTICKTSQREKCENLLSGFMPKMIGVAVLKQAEISPQRDSLSLTEKELKSLVSLCKGFGFEIEGTKGYPDSQVTIGGARLSEFSPQTLESKKHKGLYCCGELLDVDGLCGGFNLQWAFSGARMCAKSIVCGE